MRKFFILCSLIGFMTPLFAAENLPYISKHELDTRLFATLTHQHAIHLNKKGEFATVYGGKDISRIHLLQTQYSQINPANIIA